MVELKLNRRFTTTLFYLSTKVIIDTVWKDKPQTRLIIQNLQRTLISEENWIEKKEKQAKDKSSFFTEKQTQIYLVNAWKGVQSQ